MWITASFKGGATMLVLFAIQAFFAVLVASEPGPAHAARHQRLARQRGASGSCSSDDGGSSCSLNGVCSSAAGQCICDLPWERLAAGSHCQSMLPTSSSGTCCWDDHQAGSPHG